MSYDPTRDFLSLLRQTSGGVRTERMPGLDYVVVAMARAGLILLVVGQSPPASDRVHTAWFKPAVPSWIGEGVLYLWNASSGQYEVASPGLWRALLGSSSSATIVQDVAVVGPTPVQAAASVVRVMNVGAPVTLSMPPAANMAGPVLISDWANHAGINPITITASSGDTFPLGLATWKIMGDAGSVFLRPVPGGFAL